uniref:DNA polymerase lambda n=1 Tax=viral metagenome TaxID=1070528 RepID=A0A6C0EUS5_9ZZZZ
MEENGDERSESKFSDYTPERKRRSMKTFLIKPKKTMKRRYSKVGGIGTDTNDTNILIERLKKKLLRSPHSVVATTELNHSPHSVVARSNTRTKKAKAEKVEKVKVDKVKKEKKIKTEKIVKPTRKTGKKTKKVKLVIVEEFAQERGKPFTTITAPISSRITSSPLVGKKIENQNIVEERVTTPKTEIKTSMEEIKKGNDMNHAINGRMNEKFIDILGKLETILMNQTEKSAKFKARAYKKAQETIMGFNEDIIAQDGVIVNRKTLQSLPNIGDTIMKKLDEYVKTGTLALIEREKSNPVHVLGQIYGIGAVKAADLVKMGITNLDQLRSRQAELLNDNQRTGLKYYDDILARIPRSEIEQYYDVFAGAFNAATAATANVVGDSRFEIVGSFRRGALDSGDIDVIITSKNDFVFKAFIDILIKEGIILPDGVLSRGKTKCLVVARLPGNPTARRVDFLYTSVDEYPFSVLYFTGSKLFNTAMRARAQTLGYTLNEHGIYKMEGKTKGEKVDKVFKTEKEIFDFLHMVYKEPKDRIDGRSVVDASSSVSPITTITAPITTPTPTPTPTPSPSPIVEPTPAIKPKTKTLKKKTTLVVAVEEVAPAAAAAIVGPAGPKKVRKPKTLKTKMVLVGEEEVGNEPVTQTTAADTSISASTMENIHAFKKEGIKVLDVLSEADLILMIFAASNKYYNQEPLLSDNAYDIIKEYIEHKFPKNVEVGNIGAMPITRNKANLPYEMGSMDKIKPDTDAIAGWKQKYSGPYVVSCKLDGVSGLYTTEGDIPKLYTRGNGKIGQDVSHLIPILGLPKKKGIVVRGEFIMPKSVFNDKYKTTFANARNLVAGIVNKQSIDEKTADLHFVTYEVIVPSIKPSEQMKILKDTGFENVLYKEVGSVTNEALSDLLIDWRANYIYEIDGVIVADDKIYLRISGNPDHAFAFKMILSGQMAEAKVVDVIWTPSKDGYLKPRVQIEPLQLGGVKIEYATGFNAAFIQQHKIGIGALIQIIRSGDVIPHIMSVTTPADEAKMPSVPYKWNKTHVDVMLEDVGSDAVVREKNITKFFKDIGVDGLAGGNVVRIIAAGFDSVPKIIHMTKADFLKVEGFKEKLATKIYNGIQEKLDAVHLVTIMSASNLFGRGFSDKKMTKVLQKYPDILTSDFSDAEKMQMVTSVEGMAGLSANAFISRIPVFLAFLQESGLSEKANAAIANTLATATNASVTATTAHQLYGKSIVMTGARDKALVDALTKIGANISGAVSKNTFVLIATNKGDITGKVKEALEKGVPIMTPEEFTAVYLI